MGDFAFVTHPFGVDDITRQYPLARRLPPSWVEVAGKWILPARTSRITGVQSKYARADGWMVTFALTSRQIRTLPEGWVIDRILRSARLAQRLGVGVIGLGGMASILADRGFPVAEKLDVAVTTGRNYSLAVALDALRLAAGLLGKTLPFAEVVVMGGERGAGEILARLVAREAGALTLVAGDPRKVRDLSETIRCETGLVPRITSEAGRAVRQGDVVVFGGGERMIDPGDLKAGAVVYDAGKNPQKLARLQNARRDVLLIDGGLVRIPGGACCAGTALDPDSCDPRLAETMILAMEERYERCSPVGEPAVEDVDWMAQVAGKHGFRLGGLVSRGTPVTRADIAGVQQAAGIA